MKQSEEKLFMALAKVAVWRASELDDQEITNTAWAFATAKLWDEKLFTALAREAAGKFQGHFRDISELFGEKSSTLRLK